MIKILVWMLLVYTSLSASSSNLHLAPKPPQSNQKVAFNILKNLVEIKSTHQHGTKEAAYALANYFKAAGFSNKDLLLVPVENFPSQVNLIVYLRGLSRAKGIMWVSHLDVVEAKKDDWSLPPFKLTIKDGYYYGRGTADMKDEASAVAASLIRLKQEGYVPKRDIIAAFTADEEMDDKQNGLYYLLNNKRHLINADLVINPDGGSGQIIGGKRYLFNVETSEKTYATYILTVQDNGGHSSEPNHNNAIYTLSHGLLKISNYQFPFVTNDTTRMYFKSMASKSSGAEKSAMLALANSIKVDYDAANKLAISPTFNALLHTTCVPTMLEAGHQENALPQTAKATIQCRLMPGESIESTRMTLKDIVADPRIKVNVLTKGHVGMETKPNKRVLKVVQNIVDKMWPGVCVVPSMSPGASDSVYTRNAGIPSYGIGGAWDDMDDIRWHGKDERHEINDFYSTVEFTYRLMRGLSEEISS